MHEGLFSPPPISSCQLTPPPSTTAPIYYPPLSVPLSLFFHFVSLSFCFFLSPLTHTPHPIYHLSSYTHRSKDSNAFCAAYSHTASMNTVVDHLLRVAGFIGGRDKRLEGCPKDIRFNRVEATQSVSAWLKAKQISH